MKSRFKLRIIAYISAFIIYPAAAGLGRGFYNPVTALGDLMVAAMFVLCAECTIRGLRNDRRESHERERANDNIAYSEGRAAGMDVRADRRSCMGGMED